MLPLFLALAVMAFHLIRGDVPRFFEAIAGLILGFVVVTFLHWIF